MVAHARSFLFVPATRPDRFEKAGASGADAVIVDLEDAVAPAEKAATRDALAVPDLAARAVLRINGSDTEWHAGDLAKAASLPLDAVMLPKSETPEQVAGVVTALGGIGVIALIESARGLAHARAIAQVPGVVRLAFGSLDYCLDMGCEHLREALLMPRCEVVLASKLAGLPAPMDGITQKFDQPGLVLEDARHARALGMGAKMSIHPKQLPEIAQAFAPTEADVAWAHRILAMGESVGQVDGEMVDAPVKARARAILQAAG